MRVTTKETDRDHTDILVNDERVGEVYSNYWVREPSRFYPAEKYAERLKGIRGSSSWDFIAKVAEHFGGYAVSGRGTVMIDFGPEPVGYVVATDANYPPTFAYKADKVYLEKSLARAQVWEEFDDADKLARQIGGRVYRRREFSLTPPENHLGKFKTHDEAVSCRNANEIESACAAHVTYCKGEFYVVWCN